VGREDPKAPAKRHVDAEAPPTGNIVKHIGEQGAMKRQGFTLVELLVVMAIISALIGILVPSLKVAKDYAKQVICLTNQHGIGLSLFMYTDDNEHRRPPFVVDGEIIMPVYKPMLMALAYEEDRYNKGHMRPGNLGYLHREGYLDNPGLLYCPVIRKGDGQRAWADPNVYPKPWGSAPMEEKGWHDQFSRAPWIATSYHYNPYVQSQKLGWCRFLENIEDYPVEKILIMDMQGSTNEWFGHQITGVSWNVMFSDGHAVTVSWPWNVGVALIRPRGATLSHSYRLYRPFIRQMERWIRKFNL